MNSISFLVFLLFVVVVLVIENVADIYKDTVKLKLLKATQIQRPAPSLDRVKILLEDKAIDRINLILDTHINNAAANYLALTVSYDAKEGYINSQVANEMSQYILGTIKKNMTAEAISLLSLIYEINDDSDLDELLQLRVKLYMISQLVKTNSEIL